MVIIQLEGGLGNQMFGCSLYYSFLQKEIVSKLDISKYETNYAHNGYELEKIFNLNAGYATPAERKIIKPLSKLRHLLLNTPYKEKKEWSFQNNVPLMKSGFIKGYWQSEKYFKNCEAEIREKFQFPTLTDTKNIELAEKIQQTNSVSLHIRRGDYLQDGRACAINADYYYSAIDLMKDKLINPSFFIFSDDIEWTRENIREENMTFIDWNKKDKSYIDMQLMATCSHNIIANSSFSWWGAWLNPNPSKIIIAPQQWMPHSEGTRDLIPTSWIKLPVAY